MSNEIQTNTQGAIAWITLNRPAVRNAQNVALLRALDEAFAQAMADDAVKVVVLTGAGDHFSAGHDIGTAERDIDQPFERVATPWYPHADKPGAENAFVREADAYLGLCRRWRDLPKPTIAMVHGACIAGGLMLAWACDLIVASDDAFFADPVVRMGIPGVEFFAHPRSDLKAETTKLAERIAEMPRFGLALTKMAINQAEDRMGLRDSMDAAYGLHHLAHAHNTLSSDDYIGGEDVASMKKGLEEK